MELDLEHMSNISCDFGGDLMLRSGIISCIWNWTFIMGACGKKLTMIQVIWFILS